MKFKLFGLIFRAFSLFRTVNVSMRQLIFAENVYETWLMTDRFSPRALYSWESQLNFSHNYWEAPLSRDPTWVKLKKSQEMSWFFQIFANIHGSIKKKLPYFSFRISDKSIFSKVAWELRRIVAFLGHCGKGRCDYFVKAREEVIVNKVEKEHFYLQIAKLSR